MYDVDFQQLLGLHEWAAVKICKVRWTWFCVIPLHHSKGAGFCELGLLLVHRRRHDWICGVHESRSASQQSWPHLLLCIVIRSLVPKVEKRVEKR